MHQNKNKYKRFITRAPERDGVDTFKRNKWPPLQHHAHLFRIDKTYNKRLKTDATKK